MVLNGVRIIDFSLYIPGSYTSLRLAELGAEVIKIEPLFGSPLRNFGQTPEEKGVVFEAYNGNKKSIAINLKDVEGQKLAKELIEQVDVVLESFRPGVMKRFGLDYQEIKEIKNDIIYCSLSGYGQSGIMAEYGSHDLNYLALSGILSQLIDQKGRPILPSITFADIIGGIVASEKIIAALFMHEKTGEGNYLDISLMDTMLSLMKTRIFTDKKLGKDNVISQLDGELISYNIYQTKDGRYVSLAALESKFWENFCLAVGHEEWIPYHLSTKSSQNPIFNQLKDLFKSRTLEEWTNFGLDVDCCLTPILEVGEVEMHSINAKKHLVTTKDNFSPKLGEHTREILEELLNKSEQEIVELKNRGVIL
ncbi:alpha-methylacyl-CoA racemase [Vulcanibacillus modesticaldus]|uniref:Alpha-methylacyl-CoA racemase n=1 Tax=Vulcanibacillus modesticaldus TaxID=337097 RepID=A0A1D2YWV9_9BACI|nr:CaiB/BaiF CoA-transferase family protein [Vulcanibacillus modesticaldus]OEG00209.1 alpha-methylacyl-CoA racemase [Vulcanibacillus modesticaldus]